MAGKQKQPVDWCRVAAILRQMVLNEAGKPPLPISMTEDQDPERKYQRLDSGQQASLTWMADRLPEGGVVLADEVGTGKTRIACAIVHAVLQAGGRAAVVVPHGLMHQWAFESRKLYAAVPAPKELTTLTEFLREAPSNEAAWPDYSPKPSKAEWWLISHGFRTPVVRNNSQNWRVALPALIQLCLTPPAQRDDGRTRMGKLYSKINDMPATRWDWKGIHRIAQDIAPYARQSRDLQARIDRLPPINVASWNNAPLLAAFADDGDGRLLTEKLLGLWLGEFDLIVIDEAHKSRGEIDETVSDTVSGTVLARLVNVLLRQQEGGRRICLTATPMELELGQWLDLLARARAKIDIEAGKNAVKQLHDAARDATKAPDEGPRLETLCSAAREFTRILAPHVTRRRRDENPLIAEFLVLSGRGNGTPHPHRQLKQVKINWADTVGPDSPWLGVLFAVEAMRHSARGLTSLDTEGWPHTVRTAYTRLAAGHISSNLLEADELLRVPDAETAAPYTRRKIERVQYWYRQLREARQRVVGNAQSVPGTEFDPDTEHPRIMAAVEEIERWTLKREKVLVFGVFRKPLQNLRDVLNVRHALRAVDAGRPIAHIVHTDAALSGIALRQLQRLRAEGALSGWLRTCNHAETLAALEKNHAEYVSQRQKIHAMADKAITSWRADPTLLHGVLEDRDLDTALIDHLVAFILDEVLAESAESDKVSPERFAYLTDEFVKQRLRPLLGEPDGEGDNVALPQLRRQVLRPLIDDHDSRQSRYARLLHGDTGWQTRRYLQAAFNRPGGSPWILIAQSQVGREGLNLHESCRVVLQFHAEWNPAILEQQIGRVDRKGSLWEKSMQAWKEAGRQGEPPFIEIRQLVFDGTYDAFQWERVMDRQRLFDASLFGSLLPPDMFDRIPEHWQKQLIDAAPSFAPPKP